MRNFKHTQKTLLFITTTLFFFWGVTSVSAAEIAPDVVVDLVNYARRQEGVAVVEKNNQLEKAAKAKVQDMFAHNYFAHTSPEGVSPWHWLDNAGYDYRYAGENLAMNFTDPLSQQQAWMQSASHRKNILNAKYTEIGVAVAQGVIDGHETTVTVQLFGSQMKAVAAAETEKTSSVHIAAAAYEAHEAPNRHIPIWTLIAVIIGGALMLDGVYIYRRQHHKTLLIAHKGI